MEASWGVFGRLGSILGCVGNFRAVLGASWEYLEPSGRRLGIVLEVRWGRFGASCGRLGSVLEVSCVRCSVQRGLDLGMLSWMPFFN